MARIIEPSGANSRRGSRRVVRLLPQRPEPRDNSQELAASRPHCRRSSTFVAAHHCVPTQDARALPVDSESIDFILTSPPYINVHNYHQKFRRSVEALDWDVLAFARSEIGSNRQNRGNRFLTVVQYSLDMALAMLEMARVTKPDSGLILVIGRESFVRGARVFNGELAAEIAVHGVGLELERRQERVFQNRYGVDIYEDILHFRSPAEVPAQRDALAAARRVAGQVLSSTRVGALQGAPRNR